MTAIDPTAYDRLPPHNLEAEQSVLGSMLLSMDAIADIVEAGLRHEDFYKPAHQTIFTAILGLYSRGDPADPVTVAAELDQQGALTRIGGGHYILTLVQLVPTAANAVYYAKIVADKATLRRLTEAGTRIAQYVTGQTEPTSPTSQTARKPKSTQSPNTAPPRTTSH